MEGTVVSHHLAGQEGQADDHQENCVQTRAGDEQTCPETHDTSDIVLIFLTQLTASTTQPCYDNKAGQNKNIRTN